MSRTILIAEDDEMLMDLYSSAFEAKGFTVLKAFNGKEALDFLDEDASLVNFILLDIIMPKMDGLEFLGKVKKNDRYKNIPIVVSTSLFNPEDEEEAMKLGAKEYLVKSQNTPTQIIEKVEKYLN